MPKNKKFEGWVGEYTSYIEWDTYSPVAMSRIWASKNSSVVPYHVKLDKFTSLLAFEDGTYTVISNGGYVLTDKLCFS
tara:strand:- start:1852 stop:2085 length:234 start_codon:yes stop_codon:yes gene_type:complete